MIGEKITLKNYIEITEQLCDNYDALIAPEKIVRNNTNVIFLLLKAIAKGFELINNVCFLLQNKFNPSFCTDDDLESIASLVGTKKRVGHHTGLIILIKNTDSVNVTFNRGIYTYLKDGQIKFIFEVTEDVIISSDSFISYTAFSDTKGAFPVSTKEEIEVTGTAFIHPKLQFSCQENTKLLGKEDETNLEFRKRVSNQVLAQDSLVELRDEIKNLPYILDCQLYFNNTVEQVQYESIDVPPYHLVIFFSGNARNEIAEIVARKTIYSTVKTDTSVKTVYRNTVFTSGEYEVYLTPFKTFDYKIRVYYKLNEIYVDYEKIQKKIKDLLNLHINVQYHKDYIKEQEVYAALESILNDGVEILNVDLLVNDAPVNFIRVPTSKIANLVSVEFER